MAKGKSLLRLFLFGDTDEGQRMTEPRREFERPAGGRGVGHAEVRQTFRVPRQGVIAGSYVTDGTVPRDNPFVGKPLAHRREQAVDTMRGEKAIAK